MIAKMDLVEEYMITCSLIKTLTTFHNAKHFVSKTIRFQTVETFRCDLSMLQKILDIKYCRTKNVRVSKFSDVRNVAKN